MGIKGKYNSANLNRGFALSRLFDAPREAVFRAWANLEYPVVWWVPGGFILREARMQFKTGGSFHFGLVSPDSPGTWWGKFIFREVSEPQMIVFTGSYSDEVGGITRHPRVDTWPLEILNTLTFVEVGGKTFITFKAEPIFATEEERTTFERMAVLMTRVFEGVFDQLAIYLAGKTGVQR